MPTVGLEPAIPDGQQPQTHAFIHAASGIGTKIKIIEQKFAQVSLFPSHIPHEVTWVRSQPARSESGQRPLQPWQGPSLRPTATELPQESTVGFSLI